MKQETFGAKDAGTVLLDTCTHGPRDRLIMQFGDDDQYVANLAAVANLISRKTTYAPVSRRYCGTAGRYIDVKQPYRLEFARSRSAMVIRAGTGVVYTIPVKEVLDVITGQEASTQIMLDAGCGGVVE